MENTQVQDKVTATLCSHTGAEVIARKDLALLETPAATRTHTPVAHSVLVDTLESVLSVNHLKIVSEEYSVMSGGQKLFGVMKVQHTEYKSRIDYRMALGIRASNDKVFPVQLIAGANVFVCDNMAFNGSVIALKKRHCMTLDLRMELQGGVLKAIEGYRGFSNQIDSWKGKELNLEQAKAYILDAAVKGVMPLHLIPDVLKEWETPSHEEFAPRTMWSLHNAFTEGFKKLRPNVAMQSATELANLLVTV